MSAIREHRTAEQKAANIAYLRSIQSNRDTMTIRRKTILEPTQLPPWVQDAILHHEADGLPWAAICKKKKRKPSTLAGWLSVPAARKLRDQVRAVLADPVGTVKLRAQINAGWAYTESVKLYRLCMEAGDHAVAARLLNHFSELSGTKQAATTVVAPIIQINVTAGLSADLPMGSSTSEKILIGEVVAD